MAQRTTKLAVQKVLETGFDFNLGKDLQPFIDSATVIVDRVETCAIAKSKILTAGELELIERWLSCWFYKGPDPAFASKSTGGASGSFQGQAQMYLEDNRYGQRALALDYSGCLQAIAMGTQSKRAAGAWLGKRRSNQTDYKDRN